MKSIQPLIKALMQEETHTPGTTAHTDLRRHSIGVQTASLHEGRKKVCDKSCYWVTGCNLFTSKHCSCVQSLSSGEKHKPKVNLFVTWPGPVWTWNESTNWTLLCPPFYFLLREQCPTFQSRCGNGGKSSSAGAGLKVIDAAVCCSVFHIYRQLK